ncbi:hypothetical protein [Agarilytica rhodophyticola]|uniref:hypothetical protein n=1 Tax=Agarilytica rhodophyticola TaxID=1737490 RepID=UPI000B3475C4|nr:hypothetical protein [Agarilytica rhodophyticola]
MSERREPTISSYSPSKEDSPRQANMGNQRARPAQRSSAHSPAAKPVAAKSTMAVFAFLIALVACCAAGYLYWQLMEAQKRQIISDQRIADLEGKFELSGDESEISTQAMQAKLKWADSEIRKLWGVSHDTNRKAIEVNKKNIASALKTAKAASSSVDAKVQKATKDIIADLKLVSDLVDAQQSSLTTIEDDNAAIVKQAQLINDKLNSLETSKKEFERRIKTNEQAIEAIDAFRRNVNQQLLQLKGGA